MDLLPQSTAGVLRIPNFPDFCEAWKKTHIGQLTEEPAMEPFIETQKKRARNFLNSVDNTIGLRPEDLYEITSGEVVGAWLPFQNDQRRPFAVCLVADVRGLHAKADAVMEQIDKDLKAGGATRKDVVYRGETIRVYTTKPKPGQLKIDEIAITLSDVRVIAADRDTVVQDLLDAVAGKPKDKPLSELDIFQKGVAGLQRCDFTARPRGRWNDRHRMVCKAIPRWAESFVKCLRSNAAIKLIS